METVPWILAAAAFGCWLASWAMCARFRTVPPAGDRPSAARLSVIVPARNEEANLRLLLPSLRDGDEAPHEIIVVDDQSDDATAEVARAHGATVVSGRPLPDGWFGKPWACRQGAEASTGDWLLFLDADTEILPGGMRRLAALAADEMAVHSVCPHHRVVKPHEQLSAFFNVIMLLGMNAFTLRGPAAKGIGLFGQVLLVSRRLYEAVGGHDTVKREVLENFHLSRDFVKAGGTCRCWLGAGTIRMRMFPGGLDELVAGWSKGFVSGAGNTPKAALVGISGWLSGLIIACSALFTLPVATPAATVALVVVYALCVAQLAYLFRVAGTFRFGAALFFPVGLVFYQAVFMRALARQRRGGAIRWKGRDVG